MKKRKLLSVLVAAALGCSLLSAVSFDSLAADTSGVTMYRLYHPITGEHLYTNLELERDVLTNEKGWNYEGIGWIAPEKSDTPVYRLFNTISGDHHYTMNKGERDILLGLGYWNDEGIGWYSDDNKTVPLYREFNPNEVVGTHNYTTSTAEHDILVSIGWIDEGIGWFAVSDGKSDPSKEPEKPEDPEDPEDPEEPEEPEKPKYNPGDIVILGSYEQDNDLSNGAEPIEWQVVGTRDGHTLLLSKYALDCIDYYESDPWNHITWEICTLRSWLNNDFYNTAFSAADKKRIVTAHNENPDSYELYGVWNTSTSTHGASGGNATDDKVFSLSWTEVRDYFDGKVCDSETRMGDYNQKLTCMPTAYAEAQGALIFHDYDDPSDIPGGEWWLRSPGEFQSDVADVNYRGAIGSCQSGTGSRLQNLGTGVRPAILID